MPLPPKSNEPLGDYFRRGFKESRRKQWTKDQIHTMLLELELAYIVGRDLRAGARPREAVLQEMSDRGQI